MSQRKNRRRSLARRRQGAAQENSADNPSALQPIIHVFAYDGERVLEQRLESVNDVRALRQLWPVIWLNVDGLGNAQTVEEVGQIFGLHALSLEDALHVDQRPKVEHYEGYEFIVMRMIEEMPDLVDQMSMFLGKGFVVTLQERPGDCFDNVRARLRKKDLRVCSAGADFLAYLLLDALLDHYFPLLEALGERLEDLQDLVLERPSMNVVRELTDLKRGLLCLRRAIWPLRDELTILLRESTFIGRDTAMYLRDCYDHTIVLMDMLEAAREISGSVRDIYLSSVSNRTNEVMQFLTIIATIFIPLTFIAGVYGMNFNTAASPWNMPELGWYWGYPAALGTMVAVGASLMAYFWRRGWLRFKRLP